MPIVYVLSNPAMNGLVKIGRTEDLNERLRQLYSSGVAFPFTVEFACHVPNAKEWESALHQAFAPHRVNPGREFFRMEPSLAIAILKLLHVSEIETTAQDHVPGIEQVEVQAGRQYRKRRPTFSFPALNIPVGAELHFAKGDNTAIVVGEKSVMLAGMEQGSETSLTQLTRLLLELDYAVAPLPYWRYDGSSLQALYDAVYLRESQIDI